ncbi:RNA polymerase sigma factor [Streptomyces sp. cg36]|uniref:RNA polymerase sigma factor n=1 Tax=Streptomyces sp. cg36 TaxID=3238798 RepID=UPI0034E19E78
MRAPDTTTRQASKAEESVTALVDRARCGDREAFADLYVRYRPQIYTYLLRRTHDRQLSEDLTGDVFVRALARISAFTWRGSDFGAWLATIARNRLLDHYKSARHQRETPTGDLSDHDVALGDIGERVCDDLARTSVVAELRTALAGLTPGQRECLWLRYWHDLSFPEIGARMNRSTNAAKVLKERALQNLRTPDNRAALRQAASGTRTRSPSPSLTTPRAVPRLPTPRRPAPSPHLDC